MKSMRGLIRRLVKDDEGATAVEYAIMASSIAAVVAVIVAALGNKVNTIFTTVAGLFP